MARALKRLHRCTRSLPRFFPSHDANANVKILIEMWTCVSQTVGSLAAYATRLAQTVGQSQLKVPYATSPPIASEYAIRHDSER